MIERTIANKAIEVWPARFFEYLVQLLRIIIGTCIERSLLAVHSESEAEFSEWIAVDPPSDMRVLECGSGVNNGE